VNNSNYVDVEDFEVYKKLCLYMFVEWIREKIGAQSAITRTPLAVS
jgi:hypothetical protein